MNTRKRIERIDIKQKEIFKKVFKNMNLGTIFRVHPAFSMIKAFAKRYAFYKDGIVYQKPHIILEFSKRHDESIYFDSDEEMEGWFESFMEEFGKPFIYID